MISKYLADKLLNEVFRNTGYTPAATMYVALYETDPTIDDTGTELSGYGYTRKAITFAAPTTVAGKRTIASSADVTFNVATTDWAEVLYAGIRDASTAGNLLYYDLLASPINVYEGQVLKLLSGEVTANIF